MFPFFWLSDTMFRNFTGKTMKLFLYCGRIFKTVCRGLTQKRQKMASSTLQDSAAESSCLCWVLSHSAASGVMCTTCECFHLKLAMGFRGRTGAVLPTGGQRYNLFLFNQKAHGTCFTNTSSFNSHWYCYWHFVSEEKTQRHGGGGAQGGGGVGG